jgi:sec-independent protein translocase protein TatC
MSVKKGKENDKKEMSFFDHLDEFRSRLIRILLAVVAGSIGGYFLTKPALRLLKHLAGVELQALSPQVPIYVVTKLSIALGVVIASPLIFWQIWMFVSPGLYPREKKYALPVVVSAVFLFFLGCFFAFLCLPISLRFLEQFAGGIVEMKYSLDDFVSYVTSFVLGFGLVFETPLVLFFLAKIGIIDYKFLAKNRKYVILIVLIVGAILSPPDVVSQMIVSLPVYFLFELSLLMIKFTGSVRKPEKR